MKLIESNLRVLSQAHAVLSVIDNATYTQTAPHTNGIRIGAHVRHVIEFYECFFEGLQGGCIDYEARPRSPIFERNRTAAIGALDDIARQLRTVGGGSVDVRSEDLIVSSSVRRELQALVEHTIHHCALIAVALSAFGVAADPQFGVAPSTLRYRAEAA